MLTPIHKQAHSISAQTPHFLFSTTGMAKKLGDFYGEAACMSDTLP